MRRFVFVLQGLMPEESINWTKYPTLEEEYLLPSKCASVHCNFIITVPYNFDSHSCRQIFVFLFQFPYNIAAATYFIMIIVFACMQV